jgi:hypothetical protein
VLLKARQRVEPSQPAIDEEDLMLRRYVTSTLSACAFAGAVSLFAQTPAPQEQPAPPTPQEQPPPSATLTGCVIEAKTTDGGKAYVLNKAQGGTAAMYVLAGPPDSELASHVNHKVEVVGQVREPKPPSSEGAADPKVLRPPTVQVESVKRVADNCD